jgi:hypothetical protein
MVVANVRERLTVSKRIAQKFDMKKFDKKSLNDAEVKEVSG